MQYTTKIGRKLLRSQLLVIDIARSKWAGILPSNFWLRRSSIGLLERTPEEVVLLWFIWHKALPMNAWRNRFNARTDLACPLCRKEDETIVHLFCNCRFAQGAWRWTSRILMAFGHNSTSTSIPLSFEQAIFAMLPTS